VAPKARTAELVVLLAHQRANFGGKGHELRVGKHPGPKGAAVGVVVEFPDMDQLVHRTHVASEIAHQLLRVLGQDGPSLVFVVRGDFGHFSDDHRIGAQFVNGHGVSSVLIFKPFHFSGTLKHPCPPGDPAGLAAHHGTQKPVQPLSTPGQAATCARSALRHPGRRTEIQTSPPALPFAKNSPQHRPQAKDRDAKKS
jgi:hypothetical protein